MDNPQSIQEQADADLVKIRENLDKIAAEIDGHDYFRYLRAFSPGLQEYMESVSFYYFLKHRDLITRKQIEDDIQSASPTVCVSSSPTTPAPDSPLILALLDTETQINDYGHGVLAWSF